MSIPAACVRDVLRMARYWGARAARAFHLDAVDCVGAAVLAVVEERSIDYADPGWRGYARRCIRWGLRDWVFREVGYRSDGRQSLKYRRLLLADDALARRDGDGEAYGESAIDQVPDASPAPDELVDRARMVERLRVVLDVLTPCTPNAMVQRRSRARRALSGSAA